MTVLGLLPCCCVPLVLCEGCGGCPPQATVHINIQMVVQFGSSLCECDVTINDTITVERVASSCQHDVGTDAFANATHSCEDQTPQDPVLIVRLLCLATPWEDFPCVNGLYQTGYRVQITYGFVATPQAYFFHIDPSSQCAQGAYTLAVCAPESNSEQGTQGHLVCSHLTTGTVFIT